MIAIPTPSGCGGDGSVSADNTENAPSSGGSLSSIVEDGEHEHAQLLQGNGQEKGNDFLLRQPRRCVGGSSRTIALYKSRVAGVAGRSAACFLLHSPGPGWFPFPLSPAASFLPLEVLLQIIPFWDPPPAA